MYLLTVITLAAIYTACWMVSAWVQAGRTLDALITDREAEREAEEAFTRMIAEISADFPEEAA